jgi:hypothetical protein
VSESDYVESTTNWFSDFRELTASLVSSKNEEWDMTYSVNLL